MGEKIQQLLAKTLKKPAVGNERHIKLLRILERLHFPKDSFHLFAFSPSNHPNSPQPPHPVVAWQSLLCPTPEDDPTGGGQQMCRVFGVFFWQLFIDLSFIFAFHLLYIMYICQLFLFVIVIK